jgi:hypothetical protein
LSPALPLQGFRASETLDPAIAQPSTQDTGNVDSASGCAAQPSRLWEKDLTKGVEMLNPGESALLFFRRSRQSQTSSRL